MGLFGGKLGNVFSNVVNTVTQGVTSLASGIAQGVLPAVTGVATNIIGASTPLVTNVANSKAVTAGASVLSPNLSPDAIKAIAGDNNQANTMGASVANARGSGGLTPKTGLAKFFTYYKMDESGYLLYNNGELEMDWVKIAIHSGSVLTLGLVVWYGKKQRWF